MTVKELRENLSFFGDDEEVFFAFPSGDYWGTTQARKIHEVTRENVAWSSYHNSHKIIDEDHEDNYEKDELKEVLVIS